MSLTYPEWWKCWVCEGKLTTFACPDPFFTHNRKLAGWLCEPCWEKAQDIYDNARYAWRRETVAAAGHRHPPKRLDGGDS